VKVSGKGSGRVSMAALTCYRAGERPRLFYRLVAHHGRRGERRSLSEADYAALLAAAHQQLRAPLILVWDNLNTHHSAAMHRFLDVHTDWLTVVALPAYAPDLNPVEGVWSQLKHALGNLTRHTTDQLATLCKRKLKQIQYRPELIVGFLAQTGLNLQPAAEPP